MPPKTIAIDDDYEVEDDLRTLCRAAKIKKDPKRMKKVQELAKSKMMEMGSIATDDDD